ncbi:hypothetical protein H0901_08875 [Microcystis aeruginosa BLCCF158]|uniref:Uncharacterized protein n=1 Tax=Microcystis aeruginosa BLCC-F158 TaxID=2755316 RepID=A0A841UZA5_MICAE|nr:hypothetical protein [Microcystis aeruginosa]MBC1195378.1 hypothetical protein [Microcystis aeruginosa BLCC-F158]
MMQSSKQPETLSIKDAYTLYGSGKKRRYGLLFLVNRGAFAISRFLTTSDNNVLGDLSLAHLAIGMEIFTILMVWDIYAFGEKMRDRYLNGIVFGSQGQSVLTLLGFLIVLGWFYAALGAQIPKPDRIIVLLFAICFPFLFRILTKNRRE